MAAHQASPSLGFSRQEHWSGLPFPSPMHESEKWKWSCSVVLSDPMGCSPPGSSLHGIFQARVLAWGAIAFSEAHLTSHSRMSGSRWVITPSWLSGSLRCFLYSSSEYSCHLCFISSAYVRSIPFLSFIVPIFAWNVPLVSLIFLKRSLDFPILLFSSISLHWSLRKAFLYY